VSSHHEPNGERFTVKELLVLQVDSLQRMDGKLNELGERLVRLEERPVLEERVRALELALSSSGGESAYKRHVAPILTTLMISGVGWALFLLAEGRVFD
jgi:hypothetical protein